jgi:hypothetical protein
MRQGITGKNLSRTHEKDRRLVYFSAMTHGIGLGQGEGEHRTACHIRWPCKSDGV